MMTSAVEQLEYLIEMSRTVKPIVIKQGCKESNTEHHINVYESIWTDNELKAIKKKMIDCINKLEEDDNKSSEL
jgi:hypothetical protein